MWALIVAVIGVVVTFVIAFAKTGSSAEEISKNHREELLARKKNQDT